MSAHNKNLNICDEVEKLKIKFSCFSLRINGAIKAESWKRDEKTDDNCKIKWRRNCWDNLIDNNHSDFII